MNEEKYKEVLEHLYALGLSDTDISKFLSVFMITAAKDTFKIDFINEIESIKRELCYDLDATIEFVKNGGNDASN